MNTRMIYNIQIKVSKSGTGVGFVVCTRLDEEAYKTVLQQIENRKFITVIDTNQDPVTIKVDDICKICAKIELESDMYIETTEEE